MQVKKQNTIVQFRRQTDPLDQAVIAYLDHKGGAQVSFIAQGVQRAYSTILIRCLKLEAAGILKSEWYAHTRLFSVVAWPDGCGHVGEEKDDAFDSWRAEGRKEKEREEKRSLNGSEDDWKL